MITARDQSALRRGNRVMLEMVIMVPLLGSPFLSSLHHVRYTPRNRTPAGFALQACWKSFPLLLSLL